MYHPNYAYFLSVQNLKPEDLPRLQQMMSQDDFFDGMLCCSGPVAGDKDIVFDCGDAGSITCIDRDEVEEAMHALAVAFPGAKFSLDAEDVDDKSEQYKVCTFGDMFQEATLEIRMPELSPPVLFDQRYNAPARDFLNEFFQTTDFGRLHEQKRSLIEAMGKLPPRLQEDLEGIVKLLDFVADWAESEGRFVSPSFEQSVVDDIVHLAQGELNKNGEIAYTLPDNRFHIYIGVLDGSDNFAKPGQSCYWCQLWHTGVAGKSLKASCGADYNDFETLRTCCEELFRDYEKLKASMHPALDSVISAAKAQAGSSSPAPGKEPERG